MATLASRLLVVEDDPYDVELFRLALESYPFGSQLDIVGDGEQALVYLLGQDNEPPPRSLPRMVLLDLKLPKMDGLQVLEAIRKHPRTRHLTVVVMTSSEEEADLQACYALGVNSYVVKPLDFRQFQETAQQVGQYWMQLNHPAQ